MAARPLVALAALSLVAAALAGAGCLAAGGAGPGTGWQPLFNGRDLQVHTGDQLRIRYKDIFLKDLTK